MKNFKATFFKVTRELDEKGNVLSKTYSHLGSVIIDDNNVDNKYLTLTSKAYRHAGAGMLIADKVEIQEIK